jgi:hypothetical protein
MSERERFTPSDLQAKAIREIKEWFLHRIEEQQVFRVFGYAGVGKTSITRHAIAELGLETMAKEPNGFRSCPADGVLYAAFTEGGAGHDPQGHARLDHPQPDLSRLGGNA